LASLVPTNKNMSSAQKHPEVVDDYLKKEIELSNILGPFSSASAPADHINRFGVIPKKHQPGKWRLITDLSFPEGNSVDLTMCSLKYITVGGKEGSPLRERVLNSQDRYKICLLSRPSSTS